MKTKYPLDWHIVIVTVVVGVLGTVIFGWYFRILSAGAIVAIAYVGGRILWYLKRLEARQEPKDTVADAPRRYRSCRYDAGGQWHRRITDIPGRRAGGLPTGGHRQQPMPAIAHRTKNHRLNVRFRR